MKLRSLLCASRVHDEKGSFFIIFECFLLFSIMRTHAQACICWSKYTTIGLRLNNCWHVRRLLRCHTARGSRTGFTLVGPTKNKARKCFLFTEGSLKVENKEHLDDFYFSKHNLMESKLVRLKYIQVTSYSELKDSFWVLFRA